MLLIAIPTFILYLAIFNVLTGWNPQNLQGENLTKINTATIVMIAIIGPTLVYGLKPKWDSSGGKAEPRFPDSDKRMETQSETIVTCEPLALLLGSKPAAQSQFLGMSWLRNGNSNELHVDFGVIRVAALKGNLTRCRAQLKIRIEVDAADAKTQETRREKIWLDGYLNWYLQSLRDNITQNDTMDYFTLNKHFINTEVDIRQGDSRDLLVCFQVVLPFRTAQISYGSTDSVFLCNDKHSSAIGMIPADKPFEFEAKITLIALEHKSTHKFNISMSKSRILINKILEE